MIVRVTSGYFLQDLIQLDCPSNRNLVFLLRFDLDDIQLKGKTVPVKKPAQSFCYSL